MEAPNGEAASWGQGWLHALVKSEEALFSRALHRGELAGSPSATAAHAELDAFVAPWGFTDALNAELDALGTGHRARLQAYTRGFQEQLQTRRVWPWSRHEFPQPWTMEDSLLLARTWGFFSWWETRGEKVLTLLELVQNGMAWSRLSDLVPELGSEVDRGPWQDVLRPAPLGPAALSLLARLRRWRPGVCVTSPCLAVSLVTDVTEPGLPFVEMTVSTPEVELRGLSVPGIPGFFTGKSETLAWHVSPSFGDVVDFRSSGPGPLRTFWAGREQVGSLSFLFELERAPDRDALRRALVHPGAAALSLAVTDANGGDTWELGMRWQRQNAREAWLPSPLSARVGPPRPMPVTDITHWVQKKLATTGPVPLSHVLEALTECFPIRAETLLPQLRFLLPEDEGAGLKTWSGRPTEGPQALLFEQLCRAVVQAFWQTGGLEPEPDSPAFSQFFPAVDRLLAAPHSTWLPSSKKNDVLRSAVQSTFAAKGSPGGPSERRVSPRYLGRETWGGESRIFAAVVFVVADTNQDTLTVFHTDDETETPVFHDL